jgi:hypothetical protein
MRCAHVLKLIDAGPFAACSRADFEAAQAHALHCLTCGSAWTLMGELERDLAALGEPTSPPDFTAAVLSRIAETTTLAAGSVHSEAAAPDGQRWPAWAGALGGAAAVVAIQSMAALEPALFTPRTGTITASLIALPPVQPAALALALGLLLYAKGLFSVTDSTRRR